MTIWLSSGWYVALLKNVLLNSEVRRRYVVSSQMMHEPSLEAVTHSLSEPLRSRIQFTGPLWSFIDARRVCVVSVIRHTRTKPSSPPVRMRVESLVPTIAVTAL